LDDSEGGIVIASDSDDDVPKKKQANKNKTIEETYVKMDQREHALARPDMYIGSVHRVEDKQWIYAGEGSCCCGERTKPTTVHWAYIQCL
jgi:hypothetical protein